MGGFLGKLLGGPAADLMTAAKGIIDQFVASPTEKLQAQLALSKLESDFQLQAMTLEADNAKTQAEVIVAETKSESWMARNWRPIVMLMFAYIVFHNYVLAPLFSLTYLPLPDDLWQLLKLGIGGYVLGRSVEKVVPEVTKAIQESKK